MFWRIYNTIVAISVIALIAAAILLLCAGCSTTSAGRCERLAINEEAYAHAKGRPVFRVHYYWYDAHGAQFRGHAVNYLRHPDGTRTYYDATGLMGTYGVPRPSAKNVGYDSYEHRVTDGVTNAPTVEGVGQ